MLLANDDDKNTACIGWGKQLRNSPEIDGLLHSVPIKIFSARYAL